MATEPIDDDIFISTYYDMATTGNVKGCVDSINYVVENCTVINMGKLDDLYHNLLTIVRDHKQLQKRCQTYMCIEMLEKLEKYQTFLYNM